MKTNNINIGNIVISKQGRDKNFMYVVYKLEKQVAYLINGTTRKIKNPKTKNLKHINILKETSNIKFDNEKSINYEVANELKKISNNQNIV